MPPLGDHNLQISHRIPAVLELETNYKEIDIKWSQEQFPYWFCGLTTEHLVASLQDRERRI